MRPVLGMPMCCMVMLEVDAVIGSMLANALDKLAFGCTTDTFVTTLGPMHGMSTTQCCAIAVFASITSTPS